MDRTARVGLSLWGTWQLGEHRLLTGRPPHARIEVRVLEVPTWSVISTTKKQRKSPAVGRSTLGFEGVETMQNSKFQNYHIE